MRYFVELAYKGTHYHGWQYQPNAISVQEKLNDAFSKILRTPISIMGAGRTDAGVHATQMFAHFDVAISFDIDTVLFKMNSYLPDDIVLYEIKQVKENAHARFNAVSRSYEYRIFVGRNPFILETAWQFFYQTLDVEKMNEAAKVLLDHTNFKCFSKSKTDVKTYDCDITEAYWKQTGNILVFHITADRFLRNMVRAIVGTLIDIGLGKKSVSTITEIIASQNRSEAGLSVPAKGLFLTEIQYPKSIEIDG